MKKTVKSVKANEAKKLTRSGKLKVTRETVRALADSKLENVAGGLNRPNSYWCSVGQLVGGCR